MKDWTDWRVQELKYPPTGEIRTYVSHIPSKLMAYQKGTGEFVVEHLRKLIEEKLRTESEKGDE